MVRHGPKERDQLFHSPLSMPLMVISSLLAGHARPCCQGRPRPPASPLGRPSLRFVRCPSRNPRHRQPLSRPFLLDSRRVRLPHPSPRHPIDCWAQPLRSLLESHKVNARAAISSTARCACSAWLAIGSSPEEPADPIEHTFLGKK